tara:strand:+ start:2244 stop:2981 length:738 start_codon:yes stop_codon:yes gene_type:complete
MANAAPADVQVQLKAPPPAAEAMERQLGTASAIPSHVQAAIEGMGSSITIRPKLRELSEQSNGYKSTVAGRVAVEGDAGQQSLSLAFSSSDRRKGQMSAALQTAEGVLLVEYVREGGRVMGLAFADEHDAAACTLNVGDAKYGTIPGGQPVVHHADGSAGASLAGEGGCICCPCQTVRPRLLAAPDGPEITLRSEADGNCCAVTLGWQPYRKMVCPLAGDARQRLDTLILCGFLALKELTIPPGG